MGKVLLVLSLIILSLSGYACSLGPVDYSKPDMVITADLPGGNVSWESGHQDDIWVFPGSIQIGAVGPQQTTQHYIAGIKIIYPIVIHASGEPVQFHLSYQGLDYTQVSSTYNPSPAEAVNWVRFPQPEPYLQAYETRQIPVEFFVPKNASAPSRWEFAVLVSWEQPGFFQQARAVTFQINMKAINT